MNKDYLAMAVIMATSVLLLVVFVKKDMLRTAFLAVMLAQLFSWPLTLLYAQFGLQTNPVRLFPHATESNFLFAFILNPTLFTVYYLRYPKHARKSMRILYTTLIAMSSPLALLLTARFTNLTYFPHKTVLLVSYTIVVILYNVARIYIDRFVVKVGNPERNEK